jgi:hypothetical protein
MWADSRELLAKSLAVQTFLCELIDYFQKWRLWLNIDLRYPGHTMSDHVRQALEREKARLLERAAGIDRDMAEIERLSKLAAKYNLVLASPFDHPEARDPAATTMVAAEPPKSATAPSDMTIADLIRAYQTDKRSSYHQLKHFTRKSYDNMIRRIGRDHGGERISDITTDRLRAWADDWSQFGKRMPVMGNLMRIVRVLAAFGSATLESQACRLLRLTLLDLNFETARGKPLQELTREQANSIRSVAHRMGYPSVALAQAFQFDCGIRQKLTIGEWVPISEPGPPSDVLDGDRKWIRGLRWEDVEDNQLHRVVKKRPVVIDLNMCPMVMEEIAKFVQTGKQRKGPIVVSEKTKKPYNNISFRRVWREIANHAGLPPEAKNWGTPAGERALEPADEFVKRRASDAGEGQ